MKQLELAKDPSTTETTLTKLAVDEDWEVREAVAENQNTPFDILTKLAGDKSWWVREAVAENQNRKDLNGQ